MHDTTVTELKPDERAITVTDSDGTPQHLSYDMLHLVPPFRGPRWLETSNLTGDDPHGLVDIDPNTFRHRAHPNVWAAGDGAAVDTDPSGGALRQQISILVDNVLATRQGGALTDTSCRSTPSALHPKAEPSSCAVAAPERREVPCPLLLW
ncbi:FAD/NAD(P)-binding oxidoreductase [Rhodococcus oxybenzonivorans]|uniref:FAD/NAD(P)-binding oxidoreductase n=1 Tax=Rhodococcus oxybenzonivorans TaxID=1990687 RepID=UPI001E5982E1|nr:FAD/NAD(P)-binding oxidoreductase [Rhodococcus oxybenzonivorans]